MEVEKRKLGVGGVGKTYMKINFGLTPNTLRAWPGEIKKFRLVQTSPQW